MCFYSEEAGDNTNFACTANGVRHRLRGCFPLQIEVSANEEEAGVFRVRLRVEGGYWDTRFGGGIDEGKPAQHHRRW